MSELYEYGITNKFKWIHWLRNNKKSKSYIHLSTLYKTTFDTKMSFLGIIPEELNQDKQTIPDTKCIIHIYNRVHCMRTMPPVRKHACKARVKGTINGMCNRSKTKGQSTCIYHAPGNETIIPDNPSVFFSRKPLPSY